MQIAGGLSPHASADLKVRQRDAERRVLQQGHDRGRKKDSVKQMMQDADAAAVLSCGALRIAH